MSGSISHVLYEHRCRMILIVEDEPMEASLMCTMLEQQKMLPDRTPIACRSVRNGRGAMTWLAQAAPSSVSVVLLDRTLADGENGLELIAHLRQSPALRRDASVLIWSGHDEPEMIEAARLGGAHAFVSKQRVSRTLGQDIIQIIADLWNADAHTWPRPWIVLSRSSRSVSPWEQIIQTNKVEKSQ